MLGNIFDMTKFDLHGDPEEECKLYCLAARQRSLCGLRETEKLQVSVNFLLLFKAPQWFLSLCGCVGRVSVFW